MSNYSIKALNTAPTMTVKSLPYGGSYQSSAYQSMANQRAAQNQLVNGTSGGSRKSNKRKSNKRKSNKRKSNKRRKTMKRMKRMKMIKYGGGGGTTEIYSPYVPFPQTVGGDDSLNSINKLVTQTLMLQKANAQYDNNAKTGGSRRSRRSRRSKKLNRM